MIHYSLRCAKEHGFDSWFQSAAAYDSLRAAGHVACPMCGDVEIEKTLMAPAVRPGRKTANAALSTPQNDIESAFAAMRKQVEANSDYVGVNFVSEARKMHAGEIEERSIYGEAKPEEARALIEDGVSVAPLPFFPSRKAN